MSDCQGLEGENHWGVTANAYGMVIRRVGNNDTGWSFGSGGNILKLGSGDGCTALSVY